MRKAAGRSEGSKPIAADNCHEKSGKGYEARQQPQGLKDGKRQVGGEPGGPTLQCYPTEQWERLRQGARILSRIIARAHMGCRVLPDIPVWE